MAVDTGSDKTDDLSLTSSMSLVSMPAGAVAVGLPSSSSSTDAARNLFMLRVHLGAAPPS